MKKNSKEAAQRECDEWNKVNPPGTTVVLTRDNDEKIITTTRSEAFVSESGYAVAFLEDVDVRGYYLLNRLSRRYPVGTPMKSVLWPDGRKSEFPDWDKIQAPEITALRELGTRIGFGRGIQILQREWAKILVEKHGLGPVAADKGAGAICAFCDTDLRTGKKVK